jgi:hypothetical protein
MEILKGFNSSVWPLVVFVSLVFDFFICRFCWTTNYNSNADSAELLITIVTLRLAPAAPFCQRLSSPTPAVV